MFTKNQLDQLQKLLESNNKKIRKNVQLDIKITENRLRQEIQASNHQLEEKFNQKIDISNHQLEEKFNQKIDASLEGQTNVLSDLINTGYNLHERRIKRLESHLDLAPIKD